MPDDFVIARNPEAESSLPDLLRIPLGDGILLKAKDTWPRTAKVYCHRFEGWPDDVEVVERVPVKSCVRRGAAIDLVLDRGRENRSQFVITVARGRQMIFWQTARTTKQARPRATVPKARAQGSDAGGDPCVGAAARVRGVRSRAGVCRRTTCVSGARRPGLNPGLWTTPVACRRAAVRSLGN